VVASLAALRALTKPLGPLFAVFEGPRANPSRGWMSRNVLAFIPLRLPFSSHQTD